MSDPVAHLRELMREYPELPEMVDLLLAGRGTALPDWPDWCFIPMAGFHALASMRHDPLTAAIDVARLAALGTWRYTLGVYRIDDDLRAALAVTDVDGALPVDVLYRLPEWAVYVETPGMAIWEASELAGFWAHLEWDANTGRPELRILLNTDHGLGRAIVHLGPWSLREAVERAAAEAERNAALIPGIMLPPDAGARIAAQLPPLLSLLLYLCSEEPEIDNTRSPGERPHRPRPVKVKRGLRLFAPNAVTVWQVGARIGAELRSARTASESSGHRTVRPHIRRGHWHGYWRGPRDGERRFVYHWLPPMVVAAGTEPQEHP